MYNITINPINEHPWFYVNHKDSLLFEKKNPNYIYFHSRDVFTLQNQQINLIDLNTLICFCSFYTIKFENEALEFTSNLDLSILQYSDVFTYKKFSQNKYESLFVATYI